MKKHLLFLLALLCAGFACGCSDEEEKAPDSIFLYSTSTPAASPKPAEGGEQSISIFTTCAWTATSQADWIEVSPASGTEKGVYAVHLKFAPNTSGVQRSGVVVFKAGSYTETYTLIQK